MGFPGLRFVAPHWFLLLPALAAAGWYWRGLRLERPLRAACLLLAVIMLAEPRVRLQGDGLDLWVLVDQSESGWDDLAPRLQEMETILEKSRGVDDRIIHVDFADESQPRGALVRSGAAATEYAGRRSATRLASAISHVLGLMPADRAARILAITDGYSTEPLDRIADKLLAKGVALDVRLPPRREVDDFAVAAFRAPRRVQAREGLLAEVVVRGRDATVPLEILRDGKPIGTQQVEIRAGVGRVRFTDRLAAAGAHRYTVRIDPDGDAIKGNNAAEQWVEVQGGGRIVLVTASTDPPLATALRDQGLEVEVVSDLAAVHVGLLSGAEGVILDNVPAYKLDPGFVKGLEFFVTAQGGGLAMIGGKFSFAAGGWFGSAVGPLLPVSMELKQEHRKLAVAMAIVMDRSGSMSMTAPGTTQTKMALADEGAARAIELLGDNDMVVLIPVDSAAHPLSETPVAVGPNRAKLVAAARSVQSTGGGIFCYTGLAEAWAKLEKTRVGQRHVILFADAADAEEPGEYKALLDEMVKAKCTVSVIGLGAETDGDAEFLKDIAKRGGGRIFFNADAKELPALFEMETATIARSAFIEEPVGLKGTPGWAEIAAAPMDWLPQVDGYNLTYIKPSAAQAAVSADEYAAPLVAFWRRGTGRVATVAFPLGGEYSQLTRDWDGYGGFVQSLARWLAGPPLPPGVGMQARVEGTRVRLDLVYDDSWAERVAADPPELTVSRGPGGAATKLSWERLAPGHFTAGLDAADVDYVRGAVRLGESALAVGPLNVTANPEWAFDRTRLEELRAVSGRSGGVERVDLSDVWRAPRPVAWRGLRRWLLPLLVLLVLLEALATQVGWAWPRPAPTPIPA
ncbi:VWA domain-containing protein [Planctomycetia bacterium]|nr:VWA domain-containing protein [Planctomycetia bacterium]